MKPSKTKKILLLSIMVCTMMFIFSHTASAAFEYKLLEAFPGFFNKNASPDLPEMILAIYKFGIWTVGVCGLLMMTVGGVMYMGSAGNNAAAESAKKIISDSLLGIIVALGAYLFVYVINPDLVNITINFSKATLTSSDTTDKSTGETVTGESTTKTTVSCSSATGKCSQIDDAISKNSSGVDGKILKALLAGGEGCNKSQPPPSQSSSACGYSQVLGKYRKTVCGLTGSNAETCAAVQADVQLDVNCGAKMVKEQSTWCKKGTAGVDRVARCYGDQTERYVTKVTNYYANCK